MIVLVCGSREWADVAFIEQALITLTEPIDMIIEGGARGADTMARQIAYRRGWHVATVPALWDIYGRAAGPLRNKAMLLLKPDTVLAFQCNASRGTASMIALARQANLPVTVFRK